MASTEATTAWAVDALGMRKVRNSLPAPLPAAIAALLGAYVAFQLFDFPGTRAVGGDLFFVVIDAIAVLAAWGASRRCRESARLRSFWLLFAIALGGQLGGDALMAYYDASGASIPFPSPADPSYLAFYAVTALALLRIPVSPTTTTQRARIALDLASVILVGAMAVWHVVVAPTILAGGLNTVQMGTSIAYPVGDIVILGALTVVALNWSPPALHRSLQLIAAGLCLFVVADIAYGYLLIHGGYTAGGPLDILWVIALSLFALAGAGQRPLEADTTQTAVPERAKTERRASWLPYGALAIGSAILLTAEWHTPFFRQLSILLIGLSVASLIAVRQFLTQRELISVQRRLREAHDELARLASRDPLTGMRNRRSLEQNLNDELAVAQRYGRQLSILFLDIDHFKTVNDTHGHAAGDVALKEISAIVDTCVRSADVTGRWGGEEFVVVLPETSATDAFDLAERIRGKVEKHVFSLDHHGEHLTCSIGMSTHPDDGTDSAHLLAIADDAVYAAKRRGRNQVAAPIRDPAEHPLPA